MFIYKKTLLKILAAILICVGTGGQSLQACSDETSSAIIVYPTPDQILVTPNSILLYSINRDKFLPVKCLTNHDGLICAELNEKEIKLPIYNLRGPCTLHQIWHAFPGCGGCGVLYCPMNCTCFD